MTQSTNPEWKTSSDDAKRKLILDAALRVFGTRGFEEPSMDDVAAEADYTRRSLYRFFPSKEDLGISLAIRSCREMTASLQGSESTSLFDLVRTYWRFSVSHPLEFRVVLETRQLMLSGRDLPQKAEWAATDDFGRAMASRNEIERECFAAAVGYIEFRFRHRSLWQDSGLAGSEESVVTVLKKIVREEPS